MFRVVFLIFMTWLLVWFLPGHTRGAITMSPKVEHDCCAAKTPEPEGQPSEEDKANCAVCFWAAGLLPVIPVDFTIVFLERHHEQMARLATQCRSVALHRDSLPRGPPVMG